MTLIACLLALVVLILLFGAGMVKHWLLTAFLTIVGCGLTFTCIILISNMLGENGFYIVGGAALAVLLALWAYGSAHQELIDKVEKDLER